MFTQTKKHIGRPVKDETGKTYGSWTVLRRGTNTGNTARWFVRCTCGNEALVIGNTLRTGRSTKCQSCSSSQSNKTHGMSQTSIYDIWCGIIRRTENRTCKAYANYGGRGITMCNAWRNSFEQFAVDMGERPAGMSIERRNNDAPYSKDNCIWAPRSVQSRNKRTNVTVTYKRQTMCVADWAKKLNIPAPTIYTRIYAGLTDPSQILSQRSLRCP